MAGETASGEAGEPSAVIEIGEPTRDDKPDKPGWLARAFHYTLPGLWVALLFACFSFLPSLIPRPSVFQGALTGLTAAIGYGLGVLLAWIWREFARAREARPGSPRSRRIFRITAVVLLLVFLGLGVYWHRVGAELVGIEPENPVLALVVLPIAIVLFVIIIAVGRLLRLAYRGVSGLLKRLVGPGAARITAGVLVAVLAFLMLDGILFDWARQTANSAHSFNNSTTPEGAEPPTSPLRPGSPESLVEWDTLGYQGRAFAYWGPDEADIEAWSGEPALEPVRAYAGLDSAPDIESRAKLAVDDLERAGGFERANLLVVTTTGTGWVEPTSAAAFEYLSGGDSAIVSMQYSFLPSPLSFFADKETARDAGRTLFDTVYDRWRKLPAEDRPRLYAYGESLGSYGGEAAFSGEFDVANRLSGALFTGPPSFNQGYRHFVDHRDEGSTEIEPVYNEGRIIRFTTNAREPAEPVGKPWEGTRVLYMQHPSDPITWWSSDLILRRPDWLEEPRGADVPQQLRWFPVVTFWQLTVDMALGNVPGPGHGHNFSAEHVDGWAQVLRTEDWTAERSESLREPLLELAEEQEPAP